LEAEGFFLFGRNCVIIQEPTITILGLGNILMTDEGVGVHTVNEFEKRYEVPDYVEIVDGGAAGLDLIPFIEGRQKVLMVDAVNFDQKPGYIDTLENDAIPVRLTQKASMHHLGLMDVLCIVRMSGNMPKDMCIIGIQPKSLELGLDMTPEIWDKKEMLIERIVSKLKDWNIPCVLRSLQK
jgi:hydrogenase maturation protease